jgi:hypothetical protein
MANAWGWTVKRVRTFLMRLKTDAQIDIRTDTPQTVITICNYERYQSRERAAGTQTDTQTDTQGARNGHKEEQGNKETIDDDAGAAPWQQSAAYKLTKQIAGIAGQSEEFDFSGWNGAAERVRQWLESGWSENLILSSVRQQAAKKQGRPARSVKYFEPGIADAIAQASQPIPKGKAYGSTKGNGNVIDAADRAIARFQELTRPSEIGDGSGATVIRLLPERQCK